MQPAHTTLPQTSIIRLQRADGWACLAPWWSADVMIAVESDFIWAQFAATHEQLKQQAKAMPADRFRLVGRWLVREGHQVAEAELPELDWQPIAQVLQFQFPWIGSAGQVASLQSMPWQLARGGAESPVAGVIIEWPLLRQWVDTAPQWRLQQLRFCIAERDADRMALVLGTPVPPLESQYLVARQNVLIPAGMHWLPAMDVASVARSFGMQTGQWLLWRSSHDWCLIDDSLLVPLTRASVRLLSAEGT